MGKEQLQESPFADIKVLEESAETYVMLLYNDDFNTFEHVIDCLISICEHEEIQAEQCAYIVHYNGKCDIKHGDISELKPLKEALIQKGLSVVIENA